MWDDFRFYNKPKGNWRPPLGIKGIKKRTKEQIKVIEAELEAEKRTLEELLPIALEHAEERSKQEPTPYEEYINYFIKMCPETEDERHARLLANYIRHRITSYDKYIDELLSKFYVDNFFFDHWWHKVMSAIVNRYPELQVALDRGYMAKQGYADYKILKKQEKERQWREDVLRRQKEEYAKYRAKIRTESELADSIVLKEGVSKLLVYDRGWLYRGRILKVNKKTIKMKWTLKTVKNTKVENVKKVWLYKDNREAFEDNPKVNDYLAKNYKPISPSRIVDV